MIHNTQSAQISQKQVGDNRYSIMRTMYPPRYHRKSLVVTHVLGYMMYVMYTEFLHMPYVYIIYIYTTEEGYYVLESFCQNVKVVSRCL